MRSSGGFETQSGGRRTRSANRHASSFLAIKNSTTFSREGSIGPLDLFTPAQCELILKHHRLGGRRVPRKWPKGRAAKDRFFYDLATHPRLVKLLTPLLGEDIIFWGASIVEHRRVRRISGTPTSKVLRPTAASFLSGSGLRTRLGSRRFSSFPITRIRQAHSAGGTRAGPPSVEATDETVAGWAREQIHSRHSCNQKCMTVRLCSSMGVFGTLHIILRAGTVRPYCYNMQPPERRLPFQFSTMSNGRSVLRPPPLRACSFLEAPRAAVCSHDLRHVRSAVADPHPSTLRGKFL